jgi:glyoxalase family protein
MPSTPGLHHVTAVGSDPARTHAFFTDVLGLRLVKRSVNQDDVSAYHLFYGDHEGSPGTSMTYFAYPNGRQGETGTGQATTVQFAIPPDAVEYWTGRLADADVDHDPPRERFGKRVVPFEDPDGVALELVADDDAPPVRPPEGPVPEAHAIRGFFGVTLSLSGTETTAALLAAMGYSASDTAGDRQRYTASGDRGRVVDLLNRPDTPRGEPGVGTVHHVAFRVGDGELPAWRDLLLERGLRPTEPIDRRWFRSVYVRTQGGVLFEFATKSPGYTTDEDLDTLGDRLVLPGWLEDRRAEIEAGLPPLDITRC